MRSGSLSGLSLLKVGGASLLSDDLRERLLTWVSLYGKLAEQLYFLFLFLCLIFWSQVLWVLGGFAITGAARIISSQIFLTLVTGGPIAFLLWQARYLVKLLIRVIIS